MTMNKNDLLEIEINLLLVKYSKQAIIKALAHSLETHEEILNLEIKNQLSRLRNTQSTKRKKNFEIEDLLKDNPEKKELLLELHRKYENKTFLPELRDIKRFFDKHHRPTSTLKSRSSAQAATFRMLATLEKSELRRLLSLPGISQSESALGLISDQILGRK